MQPARLAGYDLIGLPASVGAPTVVLPGVSGIALISAGGVPGPTTERIGLSTSSCVEAATVVIHGPRWFTLLVGSVSPVCRLPAAAATKMSALIMSRKLRSLSFHGLVPPEIEKLTTSTWSAIAFWMPARIAAPLQLSVWQTLYWWIAAHGATPDIVTPSGRPGAGVTVLSIVLPAAVLDVCTPWPKPGFASGFGPLQTPPLLVEQSTATSFGCAPREAAGAIVRERRMIAVRAAVEIADDDAFAARADITRRVGAVPDLVGADELRTAERRELLEASAADFGDAGHASRCARLRRPSCRRRCRSA